VIWSRWCDGLQEPGNEREQSRDRTRRSVDCVASSQLRVVFEQVLRDRRRPIAELESPPVTVSCRRYRKQDLREKPSAEHSECIASVTAGAVAKAKGSRVERGV